MKSNHHYTMKRDHHYNVERNHNYVLEISTKQNRNFMTKQLKAPSLNLHHTFTGSLSSAAVVTKEFCLLRGNAVQSTENQPMFLNNMPPPYSG
jgi:hypothetical protein